MIIFNCVILACQYAQSLVAIELISAGADVNLVDYLGNTALIYG